MGLLYAEFETPLTGEETSLGGRERQLMSSTQPPSPPSAATSFSSVVAWAPDGTICHGHTETCCTILHNVFVAIHIQCLTRLLHCSLSKEKILSLFHGHDRLKSLVDEDQACAASYVPSYVLLCEPADASVTLDQFML